MKIYVIATDAGPRTILERDGEMISDAACLKDTGAMAFLPPLALPEAAPGNLESLGDEDAPLLLAPLQPGKIIAVGLNYLDHIAEGGFETPDRPVVLAKLPSSVIGPRDWIEFDPELTSRVDWEVELGVVIGARARRVPASRALEHVFGYTAANDVSARDIQFSEPQWVRCKSLDTFCPIGPCVVTADEIPDPQTLAISTRVNGEEVQSSDTSKMLFGVADLLAYLSRTFTLEPGDLILTGTPWGCGEFMEPRRSLSPGDTLETEVAQIGTLVNRVRHIQAA
jgi:5-carboxymethyl-2-hydroxymuconate isomerase